VGHTKITPYFFVGVDPFLLTDDEDRLALEAGDPRHHGRVISQRTVSVEFYEIIENMFDEGAHPGALRVAREQNPLPGRNVGEDCFALGIPLGHQFGTGFICFRGGYLFFHIDKGAFKGENDISSFLGTF